MRIAYSGVKIFVLTTMILVMPYWAFAGTYLAKAEELIKNIFPELKQYKWEDYNLDGQKAKVLTAACEDKILGWGIVLDEMGKINPITFLVGIDNQGKVLAVYVLEYRDMFGAEIQRKSFLRQFQGKSANNQLIIGRDIDAVTSATMSSKAAATAVKKSLRIVQGLKN